MLLPPAKYGLSVRQILANMPNTSPFNRAALQNFEKTYDNVREQKALHARGEFLDAFPITGLKKLTLDRYVIGQKTPTFCAYVEAKTRSWAVIQGATSFKFGIYYGVVKGDKTAEYRFTRKFGETRDEAFANIKEALLELVQLGAERPLNFEAIDANLLSQMFKAKILSLYYPDKFTNVCSRDHLTMLGQELGLGEDRHISEFQNGLARLKDADSHTREWSNPKFMLFLYNTYINTDDVEKVARVRPPRKKSSPKVDFDALLKQRDAIGLAAEEFALEWEKQRLIGDGLVDVIDKIKDRREYPGDGYDFRSFSSRDISRFIEVKAVGKAGGANAYRFFLSANEHVVSLAAANEPEYYFYLVFFNRQGQPYDLLPIKATVLYECAELTPAAYQVRFDLEG
ncbi:MAG: DUF3883 domain-containing protein [Paraburkholderia sp.]|uniref:DUF3883 domain-containing protein n=1 Tax=Paraburkholderia sp. TaxID=1926495 RepID=UPI003C643EFD